jgi:hypothetical protein
MILRPDVRARARGEYRWRVDCGLMRVLLLVLRSVDQHTAEQPSKLDSLAHVIL